MALKPSLLAVAVLAGICGSGCTSAYWMDRGRDAADIFTLSVGTGVGAKARVGPVGAGLLYYRDVAGLRGGQLQQFAADANRETYFVCLLEEGLALRSPALERGKGYRARSLLALSGPALADILAGKRKRGGFDCGCSGCCWCNPVVTVVRLALGTAVILYGAVTAPIDVPLRGTADDAEPRWHLPYLTQIEVTAACLGGVRAGFNPGELIDFILGWTTLDLFNDDIGR
jgi:hypothetical protein